MKTLFGVYAAVAVVGTAVKLAPGSFVHLGIRYEPLQNWAIFRNAFFHLIHGQTLYGDFPQEQWDQYKYSPPFALLLAPLAALPYRLGVFLWNLLNMLALFAAIRAIPSGGDRQKAWALWFILLPATGSMLNAQSNGIVAALMIAGWTAQENGSPAASALSIMLSVFVKLFGALVFLPCLLGRAQRKLMAYAVMWGAVLAALPFLAVRPRQVVFLYQSWYRMLQNDHATRLGMSVMALLKTEFGLPVSSTVVVLIGGAILVLVPLARWDARESPGFRLLALASVLIWVVMFNHLAESPSFVIAVAGVALWFFFQEPTTLNLILLLAVFLGTSVSSTDIVPRSIRPQLLGNYIKLLPCIPVWIKIQYDLLRFRATRIDSHTA